MSDIKYLKLIFQIAIVLAMLGLIWMYWTAHDSLWRIGIRVSLTSLTIAVFVGVLLNLLKDDTDTK